MRKVQCDGTYPEQCVRLMKLVPEQVMNIVQGLMWVEESETGKPVEDEDTTFTELDSGMWINKGWKLYSRSHRTAVYKHDERWWLIQFYGKPGYEEKNA